MRVTRVINFKQVEAKLSTSQSLLLIIWEREERKVMQRCKLGFEQRGICFIMMVRATVLFQTGKRIKKYLSGLK